MGKNEDKEITDINNLMVRLRMRTVEIGLI